MEFKTKPYEDGVEISSAFRAGDSKTFVLHIPDEIDGLKVRSIGRGAFDIRGLRNYLAMGGSVIEELQLPNTLRVIKEKAFRGHNIEEVTIPGNVQTIGEAAFRMCRIENLNIEKGVEIIKKDAFNTNDIKVLKLPETIKCIETSAFERNQLKNVELPNSLVKVDNIFTFNYEIDTLRMPREKSTLGSRTLYGARADNVTLSEVTKLCDSSTFGAVEIKNLFITGKIQGDVELLSGPGVFIDNIVYTEDACIRKVKKLSSLTGAKVVYMLKREVDDYLKDLKKIKEVFA